MFEITAPAAPVIEAATKKAKALVFVIDRSGSMDGSRLESVKNVIVETLPRLNPEDSISVVTFDNQAQVVVPLIKVAEADIKGIRQTVSGIYSGGSTNLEAGYRLGLVEAAKVESGVEANIILLSDGQANAGLTDPAALANIATAATEHFVTTSTIGIGEGYDENVLSALADGGNGNHIAGITQGEALDGLQSEIDGLLAKTMLDVKFEIVLGPDFSGPKSDIVAGRRMKKWKKDHGVVQTLLGDLASEEERNAVFDITLDPHQLATPGVKQGIKVSYSYLDVASGQTVNGEETFEIELVKSADWVEPERDADITSELMMVRARKIYEEAMDLYMQNKIAEADALTEAAGKQMQEFMKKHNLTPRQYDRMMDQSTSFLEFSNYADLNMKRKMNRMRMSESTRGRKRRDIN
jgi:Ca-activated chloride channel family protein